MRGEKRFMLSLLVDHNVNGGMRFELKRIWLLR